MILNFSDELGKRHFEYCFVGFILGGSFLDKKGLSILRREMNLFEKFENISELFPCGKKLPNGEPQRQLISEGNKQIEINESEFDMLYNYISMTPWQVGTPTRNAFECLDWLMSNK
jgi:hypothetical protein